MILLGLHPKRRTAPGRAISGIRGLFITRNTAPAGQFDIHAGVVDWWGLVILLVESDRATKSGQAKGCSSLSLFPIPCLRLRTEGTPPRLSIWNLERVTGSTDVIALAVMILVP